ncbi:ATP-binding cassette domain-containing protein [Aquirufa nivalisilvae]
MNISINDLIAGYDKKPAIILNNFEIRESDRIIIVEGKNSSGKTSFLKSLVKATPNNSGEIYFDDILFSEKTRSGIIKKIGFCLITGLSYPHLSLVQNIGLYKLLYDDYSINFVDELIEKLNFQTYKNLKCSSLSIGKRKIADFIIAVFHHPELVILDEPIANLDSETIERLITTISFLVENEGMQFIIASNDIENFNHLKYRKIQIADGKILE